MNFPDPNFVVKNLRKAEDALYEDEYMLAKDHVSDALPHAQAIVEMLEQTKDALSVLSATVAVYRQREPAVQELIAAARDAGSPCARTTRDLGLSGNHDCAALM